MAPAPLPPFPDQGRRPSPGRVATARRIEHLEAVPLFSRCSKRDLRRLVGHTRLDLVAAGEVLIRQGQPSTEAFVILAGKASVKRNGRNVARLGPGDVVGELGLILDRERGTTVAADTPLEVLVLDRKSLKAAINDVPGLGWKLLETVAERLTENANAAGGSQAVGLDVASPTS